MRRTRWTTILILVLVGAVIGWLIETILTGTGHATLVPPLTLPIALLAIGIILVLLAVPIRRATRTTKTVHVDPFHAMRIVLLAKAGALAGALLAGLAIGIVLYLLSRKVLPVGSVWLAAASAFGGALLLAGGLYAEHLCTLPPDDGAAT